MMMRMLMMTTTSSDARSHTIKTARPVATDNYICALLAAAFTNPISCCARAWRSKLLTAMLR